LILVVIGPEWIRGFDGWSQHGIDQEGEWVRQEARMALVLDVPIIPILAKGVKKLPASVLPEDLGPLVERPVMELRHDHWEHDIELLFGRLKRERLFPSKTERKDEAPYPQRLQGSPDPLSEDKDQIPVAGSAPRLEANNRSVIRVEC